MIFLREERRMKYSLRMHVILYVSSICAIVFADLRVPSAFPLSAHVVEQRSSLWLSFVVNKIEAEDFRVDISADRLPFDRTKSSIFSILFENLFKSKKLEKRFNKDRQIFLKEYKFLGKIASVK